MIAGTKERDPETPKRMQTRLKKFIGSGRSLRIWLNPDRIANQIGRAHV